MSEVSESNTSENAEGSTKKKSKFFKEAKSITLIIILVLAFRSVFFEPFKIPSGSMIPTLLIGDFILVNKFAYGFKVPFSQFFGDPIYITGPNSPKRGDVIVFKYPQDTSLNYIKRVVGLPGDTVEVIDKVVYVNGQPLDAESFEGELVMKDMDEKFKNFNLRFYKAKTGDHVHLTQVHMDNVFLADHPREVVPEGHYFVMGDNRDFSSDSRRWGFVPFNYIKGEAMLVWFSMSVPFPWSDMEEDFTFRPWRIGTMIDDAPGLEN
ncbi:MAG: signal peptidase I [Halobacteriovoraceae bacterium]|nr:signal peptidase I [Halobacteriovoraceae bacterium]|tara:strand:- start:2222 stop:3016 length:795 start_codon:yes stop_codon:yes gene_type:complete